MDSLGSSDGGASLIVSIGSLISMPNMSILEENPVVSWVDARKLTGPWEDVGPISLVLLQS